MHSGKFAAYVRLADNGANTWPRIVATVLFAMLLALAATMALFVGLEELHQGGLPPVLDAGSRLAEPEGIVLALLSLAVLWPALWVGLRLFHRRPLASVVGHDGWAGKRDLGFGLLVGVSVGLLATLAALPFGPVPVRSDLGLATWLLAFLPIAALVLLQASAEEAVFRGYLPQVLAAKGFGMTVWVGAPFALFVLGHWLDDVPLWKNLWFMAAIAIVAVGMTVLVVATGRIAAACGVHWGTNIVALQTVALDDEIGGAALYHLPALADPAWDAVALGAVILVTVPATALQVALLLHRRSPLCIVA